MTACTPTPASDTELIAELRAFARAEQFQGMWMTAGRYERAADRIETLTAQQQRDRVRGAEAVLTEQLRTSAAEARLAQAEATIEQAPHHCRMRYGGWFAAGPCTCWKADYDTMKEQTK